MLLLTESLMLTALHDEKGTIIFSAADSLPFALAGAVLMDLFFARAIDLANSNVIVKSNDFTGEPILDAALEIIFKVKKEKSVKYWVSRIGNKIKSIKTATLESLIARDILYKEQGKILIFFPITRYKTNNPAVESDLKNRLRSIALFGDNPNERDTVLLSLINTASLLRVLFDSTELKSAHKRIKEISDHAEIGKSVSAVVQEMQAAVIGALVAATAASVASSSS